MATRKLNSIKFPDLADTYILDADKVQYDPEETYESGSVGEALQNKANTDGSYESMTVGNAEQLVSNVRVNDKTPYLFRTSGGSVDIGDREYVNGIVGGTVAWNQLCGGANARSATTGGVQFSYDASKQSWTPSGTVTAGSRVWLDGVSNAVVGHKLLIWTDSPEFDVFSFSNGNTFGKAIITNCTQSALIDGKELFGVVLVLDTTYSKEFHINCFDLTQMFGSTIADYIYSLEQATAGAGVAWFKKLFPKPYYEYNARELKSVSGLVSHDMTGFNQWDEEWEVGGINIDTGEISSDSTRIRSKNFNNAVGGATYYAIDPTNNDNVMLFYYDADKNYLGRSPWFGNNTVIFPANARYFKFIMGGAYGTTYKNDICINVSWDGSRNGEYEPYELHSYPLDSSVVLRGIPKLDANNNLYYDGDVYESDGTVNRKYGIVDLGTLTWVLDNAGYFQATMLDDCKHTSSDVAIKGVCSRYKFTSLYTAGVTDKCIGVYYYPTNSKNYVRIKDSAYSDAATFKTAMNGVYLVYELATPTTEEAEPYTSPQIVDDFGTEEYVISDGTFAVPVGHDTDYPVNLVAKLEMAPNSPEGNGDYIVRQVNGENSYVPLVIEDALPTIPSTAGTYKLTVTVADGSDPVLSWEAE